MRHSHPVPVPVVPEADILLAAHLEGGGRNHLVDRSRLEVAVHNRQVADRIPLEVADRIPLEAAVRTRLEDRRHSLVVAADHRSHHLEDRRSPAEDVRRISHPGCRSSSRWHQAEA